MKTKFLAVNIYAVLIVVLGFWSVKNVRSQFLIPEPDIYWQTGKFQWSDVPIESGVICWARGINGFSLYSIVKFHNVSPGTSITMQGATCERNTTVTAEQRRPWAENYWGVSFSAIEYGLVTPTATSTHTATLTSSTTATPTSTPSETETVTSSPTRTETETTTQTSTQTPTETKTSSYTSTATVSATSTSTETDTATATRTITRTNSATSTRTSTPTVTPVLAPDKVVPRGISTLHLAKEGHICYGEVVGEVRNSVVEFVTDYSTGIEVSGGGCFTQKYYNLSQVMRYLESKGIKLSYISLPRPTLTPSRTIPPTLTVARYLAISFRTDDTRDFMVTESGTVCWGAKVGSIEYKVVKFPRSLISPIRITSGGCTVGQNLSAEDVFNYLRRVFNTPLSGFVDYK